MFSDQILIYISWPFFCSHTVYTKCKPKCVRSSDVIVEKEVHLEMTRQEINTEPLKNKGIVPATSLEVDHDSDQMKRTLQRLDWKFNSIQIYVVFLAKKIVALAFHS